MVACFFLSIVILSSCAGRRGNRGGIVTDKHNPQLLKQCRRSSNEDACVYKLLSRSAPQQQLVYVCPSGRTTEFVTSTMYNPASSDGTALVCDIRAGKNNPAGQLRAFGERTSDPCTRYLQEQKCQQSEVTPTGVEGGTSPDSTPGTPPTTSLSGDSALAGSGPSGSSSGEGSGVPTVRILDSSMRIEATACTESGGTYTTTSCACPDNLESHEFFCVAPGQKGAAEAMERRVCEQSGGVYASVNWLSSWVWYACTCPDNLNQEKLYCTERREEEGTTEDDEEEEW